MIHDYLQLLNIKELKPMQVKALDNIKNGSQVILLSPTGTGKTLAFLLPLVELLDASVSGVQALILLPSRELALQIEKVFKAMKTGFKVNTCYGGHPITTELNNLSIPPSLLIGTPGRIADHIRRKSFNTKNIRTIVLDEFDKSLELGFKDEMEFIIGSIDNITTKILTSATNLEEIPAFVELKDPIYLDFLEKGVDSVLIHKLVRSEGNDKLDLLGQESNLVFCNHREAVNRISELLTDKGIAHGIFHGGMEQDQREVSLIKFRNGTHHILLTTDLAARGLDIPEIKNVIHYQLPTTRNSWMHRNGRTARMDKNGSAWLVMAQNDYIPDFITEPIHEMVLGEEAGLPDPTPWETIYISLGRKDKISKGDIAGFLMQVGLLKKEEIGRIEVQDYASFAAIDRSVVKPMLKQLSGQQIKRKTVKVEIAH